MTFDFYTAVTKGGGSFVDLLIKLPTLLNIQNKKENESGVRLITAHLHPVKKMQVGQRESKNVLVK